MTGKKCQTKSDWKIILLIDKKKLSWSETELRIEYLFIYDIVINMDEVAAY